MKIRPRLIFAFSASMIAVAVIISIIAYFSSSSALISEVENRLLTKASDTAIFVEERINGQLKNFEILADLEALRSMNWEEQQPILSTFLNGQHDVLSISIVDPLHNFQSTGEELTLDEIGKSVVDRALSGDSYISDVLIDEKSKHPFIYVTVPIKQQNNIQGAILARIDGRFLSIVAQEINIGETGYSFIVNKEGVPIGHINEDFVVNRVNFIEVAENDDEFKPLARLLSAMITGETGVVKYYFQEHDRISAYTAINGTDWSVGVSLFESEALESLNNLKMTALISTLIILICGVIVAFFIGGRISKPLIETEQLGTIIATGDFTIQVPENLKHRKDEVGSIARVIDNISENMRIMISEISANAQTVASQSEQLSVITEQSSEAANDVAEAIQQVAEASETQVLSSEESVVAIVEMSTGVQRIADTALELTEFSNHTTEKSRLGSTSIHQALAQMNLINQSSTETTELIHHLKNSSIEIGEIVQLIATISEQTNLLALNAAIEAARAGNAGNGFAVVAKEIRILSEQTANSTIKINQLIQAIQTQITSAVSSVNHSQEQIITGTKTLQTVDGTFKEILLLIEQVNEQIGDMSAVSEEMSASSEQVSASITEMADKAKQSSANAQQVAAASEEQLATNDEINHTAEALKEMAQQLNALARRFKV